MNMPKVGRRVKITRYHAAADLTETAEGRVEAVKGTTVYLGKGLAAKSFPFPEEEMEWEYVLPPEPEAHGALWFIPGLPGTIFQRRDASFDGPDFCWYRAGSAGGFDWSDVTEHGEGYLLDPQKGRQP